MVCNEKHSMVIVHKMIERKYGHTKEYKRTWNPKVFIKGLIVYLIIYLRYLFGQRIRNVEIP